MYKLCSCAFFAENADPSASNTIPSEALRINAQIKYYIQLAGQCPGLVIGVSVWLVASQTTPSFRDGYLVSLW